jgi:hypothetical protein
MAHCHAYLDNGNKCTRKIKYLDGLCGYCHGITDEWKRCTHRVRKGEAHCGRKHQTLDEIAEHRASRRRASHQTRAASGSGRRSPQSQHSTRQPTKQKVTPRHKSSKPPRKKGDLSNRAKKEAARLCAEAIAGQGVLSAFESQITEYVSDKIVEELSRNWDGRQCDELAKLARQLLAVKSYFYRAIQIVVNWIMLKLGFGSIARFFVCQLITALPVAWYAKLVTAARILQVTGICLCFMNDRSLTECKCLHDLVVFEGKEAISRLMTAAAHDWREISERVPEAHPSEHEKDVIRT